MTIDKSLKVKAGMNKVRNVMTRGERVLRLKELDKWTADSKALGLPKVRVMKLALKKKKKAAAEGDAKAPAKGGKGAAAPAKGAAAPAKGAAKK